MTAHTSRSDLVTGATALRAFAANSHNSFSGGSKSAVARIWSPAPVDINVQPKFKLSRDDALFTVGCCFTRAVEHALTQSGIRTLPERFDFPIDLLAEKPARLAKLANNALDQRVIVRAVLNKQSPLSILNDFQRTLAPETYNVPLKGLMQVDDDRWYDPQTKDTGMHALKDSLLVRFLVENATREVTGASAVLLSLGLTETWFDSETQTALNFAPPHHLIKKWPDRFRFFNADYSEVLNSLERIRELITTTVRPDMKFIVTVSPAPLQATFTGSDVITANTRSKSILRAAAEAFCDRHENADYFPSLEMVYATCRDIAWRDDRIHVKQDVIDFVIGKFVDTYFQ